MRETKIGLTLLTALVVGNMVGSGIFMLPSNLAKISSPGGMVSAWLFTGAGVLVTALVFGNLALRKPKLVGGPQIYAKELFPQNSSLSLLSAFMTSWGYWIGNLAGNVAIITTFASYLSTFFPVMNNAYVLFDTGFINITVGRLLTFIVCSAMLWVNHFVILRGIDLAGRLNFAATAAKVAGFFIFIIVSIFAFQQSNLVPFVAETVTETGESIGLFGQISAGAIATLWAFIGIESAVVLAGRAKKPSDVKYATVIGLFIALAIYIGITVLVRGVLPHDQLIQSEKPLIDAMNVMIGSGGSYLLAGLGLISLIGSCLGWILLSAEVPYQAAKQGMFIPKFMEENDRQMPTFSMMVTNGLAQLFIFSTISNSVSEAFNFIVYVATLSYLAPYLISTLFQLKLVMTGETYKQGESRIGDGIIAVLASAYSLWVCYAGTADLKTFLFGVALFVSGIFFYPLVQPKNAKVRAKKVS